MAGTAIAFAAGDMLPLLDDNGSGVYVKGRNTALDFRAGLLGALFLPNANSNIPKPGVLTTNTAANGNGALLPQGTPSQQLTLTAGRFIVPRAGQGAYLLDLEVDQVFTMPAASSSNFRTDVVCLAAFDKGNFVGDAAHGPNIWVEQGTLGGGVPATPTGMLKLHEVFRAANDNAIAAGEITDRRVSTSLNGALRVMGPGETAATVGTALGEMRYNGDLVEVWNGTAWVEIGRGKIGVEVRATAQQTGAAGGATKLNFGGVDQAAAGITWNGSNSATILTPGDYALYASVNLGSSATGNWGVGIHNSTAAPGGTTPWLAAPLFATGQTDSFASTTLHLDAGQTLSAWFYNNEGATRTLNDPSHRPAVFRIKRVGP